WYPPCRIPPPKHRLRRDPGGTPLAHPATHHWIPGSALPRRPGLVALAAVRRGGVPGDRTAGRVRAGPRGRRPRPQRCRTRPALRRPARDHPPRLPPAPRTRGVRRDRGPALLAAQGDRLATRLRRA